MAYWREADGLGVSCYASCQSFTASPVSGDSIAAVYIMDDHGSLMEMALLYFQLAVSTYVYVHQTAVCGLSICHLLLSHNKYSIIFKF